MLDERVPCMVRRTRARCSRGIFGAGFRAWGYFGGKKGEKRGRWDAEVGAKKADLERVFEDVYRCVFCVFVYVCVMSDKVSVCVCVCVCARAREYV